MFMSMNRSFCVYLAKWHLCLLQKFAEKPKGKELDEMKVDTSVLGKHLSVTSAQSFIARHCMLQLQEQWQL